MKRLSSWKDIYYISVFCLFSKVIQLKFPTKEELGRIGSNDRLNLFRRYFSTSRYNRLLIQQRLIRSAYDGSLISKVKELERIHEQDFFDKVKIVKESGFSDEYLVAVKEEEQALQKIIDAYDKRISEYFTI